MIEVVMYGRFDMYGFRRSLSVTNPFASPAATICISMTCDHPDGDWLANSENESPTELHIFVFQPCWAHPHRRGAERTLSHTMAGPR